MKHKITNLLIHNKRLTKYITHDKEFDFNRVVMRPDELSQATILDISDKDISEHNLKKYGYENWLEWSKSKWGTIFNAYNTKITTSKIIEYSTDNTPPLYLLEELSANTYLTNIWLDSRDNSVYRWRFLNKKLTEENKLGEIKFVETLKNDQGCKEWDYTYIFKNFHSKNISEVLKYIANIN